jgi:SAM-dependent methyltransferase
MDPKNVQSHYETVLARNYVWLSGGWEAGIEKNRRFFASNNICPESGRRAVDLGAGCGFQSIPLALAGFHVIAVEFSRQMLAILHHHAGDLPIRGIHGDILDFGVWAGQKPDLITCMGDTLAHLPDLSAAKNLLHHAACELVPGGKIIISFRDYSQKPEGSSEVIPVCRDQDRIFLCRLDYGRETVRVEDILYQCDSGTWGRISGTYPKIRLPPDLMVAMMADEGLELQGPEEESGMTTLIAEKPV